MTDRCAPLAIAGKQAQLLHAQADGGARRELPRAEAHERLGDAAMRKEQPECAKEEEYAGVRLLLHAMPAHSCPTAAASPTLGYSFCWRACASPTRPPRGSTALHARDRDTMYLRARRR